MPGIGYLHDGKEFVSHVDGKIIQDRKMQTQEILYPTKIEMKKIADYSAAMLNIIKLAKYQEVKGENIYYYLTKTKVIKTNNFRRTIELSDRFNEDAKDIINKILYGKNKK